MRVTDDIICCIKMDSWRRNVNQRIREKGKLFLSVQSQLIDVEKNYGIGKSHLSAIIMPDSGKTHQWILRVVEKV